MPRNDRAYTGVEKSRLQALPGAADGSTGPAIYWGRETFVPGVHAGAQARLRRPSSSPLKNIKRHRRPRAARGGHPDLRDRLQADPDLQHLLPRARRRQRRPGHRRHRQGHRRRDRHPGRRRAPDRRADRRHRLPHHRPADRPAHHRPRRAARWPRVARDAGWRPTRAPPSPDFPNLFLSSAPTPGSGHSSMVFMIESQVAYILDAVRTMRAHGYATVEP